MIFTIHNEGKIAFKRLSNADLARSAKSHQTHIGLSIDSLTFMPDDKTEYQAMLIYNDFCDILRCEIAKIHRANGRLDAPNIKKGGRDTNNVVSKIRSFASKKPLKDFYLLWFGLEDSLTPVFLLIESGSADFNQLNSSCSFSSLGDRDIVILERGDRRFQSVLSYVKSKLESVTVELQKDLEYVAEVDSASPKFKDADVKRAKSYIYALGRAGEDLINEYLNVQKHNNKIKDFEWANKSGEQGKPYDFHITHTNNSEQWIDVKTTEHEFEQSIIVSKNEVNFIETKQTYEYAVFRVYSKTEIQAKLKICSDCLAYIKKLNRDIDYIKQSMADYRAAIVNYKIAIEPSNMSFKHISEEIGLPV